MSPDIRLRKWSCSSTLESLTWYPSILSTRRHSSISTEKYIHLSPCSSQLTLSELYWEEGYSKTIQELLQRLIITLWVIHSTTLYHVAYLGAVLDIFNWNQAIAINCSLRRMMKKQKSTSKAEGHSILQGNRVRGDAHLWANLQSLCQHVTVPT